MALRYPTVLLTLLASYFSHSTFAQDSSSNATVLNVPVSQYWEGQDGGGVWSTFALQVGTPPQNVRLLPGTSSTGIWVVVPQGCIAEYGSETTCSQSRGGIFDPTESTSWEQVGIYNLNLFTEAGLGYYANGEYGFDNITLGTQGSGLPGLQKQVIAGFASPEFWVGVLPLSPWPLNFTTMNQPQDGLLTSLKKSGDISSLSWGYTAGANGLSPQVYGSLTLGGYDTTRFVENNVTFGMYTDISRDLLAPISKIQTSNGYRYSPSQAEYYFIDSVVPDLWLPPAACNIFEQAFSLTLDNSTGLYLVNSSLHSQLVGQNVSVTFTLGPGNDVSTGQSSDTTFEIEMPYWAFDLTAGYPLVDQNSTVNYFPLRQASSNTSQYTLGRAFLQSAYVIADHERFNFSVHQALFPNNGASSNLVPILSKDASNGSNGTGSSNNDNSSSGISGGAIAGIVIGVIAVLAIVGLAGFFLWRKKKHTAAKEEAATPLEMEKRAHGDTTDPRTPLYEADDGTAAPSTGMGKRNMPFAEADGNESSIYEAPPGSAIVSEMDAQNAGKKQPQQTLHQNVFEMDSGVPTAAEMESPYATPRGTPSHTPTPGYNGQRGNYSPGGLSAGAPSPGVFSPSSHGAPSPVYPNQSAGPSPIQGRSPLGNGRRM